MLHLILALPWWATAITAAFLALASPDFESVTLLVLGLAALLLVAGVAVLTARRWLLMVTAVVGGAVGFIGVAGMGIRFIDATPSGLTGTAWTILNIATIAALASAFICLVLGIMEVRRPPADA